MKVKKIIFKIISVIAILQGVLALSVSSNFNFGQNDFIMEQVCRIILNIFFLLTGVLGVIGKARKVYGIAACMTFISQLVYWFALTRMTGEIGVKEFLMSLFFPLLLIGMYFITKKS